MCQQTQVATVIPYFERWMEAFPDWEKLSQAQEQQVLKLWEGLGYYRRARFLHALAKEVGMLARRELPDQREALKKLPGIGDYTAAAIASIAFGKREAVVDGNVIRVLARFFYLTWDVSQPKNRKLLNELAQQLAPEKNCGDYNQAMMELGATVCRPGKPDCPKCPLSDECRGRLREPEKLPVIPRKEFIAQQEEWAWIRKSGKILLVLPENAKRWRGMYRLPDFDSAKMSKGKELSRLDYIVTRHRISAVVYETKSSDSPENAAWFSLGEIEKMALPVPHRKALASIVAVTCHE